LFIVISCRSTGYGRHLTSMLIQCFTRNFVVNQIETIFEQQIDAITSKDQQLSVTVKSRTSQRASQKPIVEHHGCDLNSRTFRFPGKTEKDAWRYSQLRVNFAFRLFILTKLSPAVIIRILELVHDALVNDVTITKRCHPYRFFYCRQMCAECTFLETFIIAILRFSPSRLS
jgi:hypothetical protein